MVWATLRCETWYHLYCCHGLLEIEPSEKEEHQVANLVTAVSLWWEYNRIQPIENF